jgi:GTP-binding protein
MIKDTIEVRISAGDGGNGGVKFSKGVKKFPTGGDGGRGGDIYVVGSTDLQDLRSFDDKEMLMAESGVPGGINQQNGADGNDMTIKVPVVTEIYDPNGKLMHVVKKLNQPYLLLRGGEGGLGNYFFRRGFEGRFDHSTKGKKGERFNATLKFKLVADIVFIGFPNAGKSSLLNALTRANVKVGSYAFTTINPHLGRMNDITLMDLPGLIEGTSEGKGLGPGFLQHTHYSKVVAHFLSLESDDLLRDYNTMREELKNLDPKLLEKKEILLLTKSDEFTPEEIAKKAESLKSIDLPKVICSSIDDNTLKEVARVFEEAVKSV